MKETETFAAVMYFSLCGASAHQIFEKEILGGVGGGNQTNLLTITAEVARQASTPECATH